SSDPVVQREAYAWYIVSGEAGDASARQRAQELNRKIPQSKIGEVRQRVAGTFEESLGGARDLSKAYEWYLLAENSGADVQPQLDRLRQQMTPEQVRLAQSTAGACLQRHRATSAR